MPFFIRVVFHLSPTPDTLGWYETNPNRCSAAAERGGCPFGGAKHVRKSEFFTRNQEGNGTAGRVIHTHASDHVQRHINMHRCDQFGNLTPSHRDGAIERRKNT